MTLIWMKHYLYQTLSNAFEIHLNNLFITRKFSNEISNKKEIFICLKFLGKNSLQSKKQSTEIFIIRREKSGIECCVPLIEQNS